MPEYEPPTIDDLSRIEKGGGGETVDKRFWTARMWERRQRSLDHALTTASWLHLVGAVVFAGALLPLVLGSVWWAYALTCCSVSFLNAALLAIWLRRR